MKSIPEPSPQILDLLAECSPQDMRAVHALKRSPLALDLYAWTIYRAFTVTKKESRNSYRGQP